LATFSSPKAPNTHFPNTSNTTPSYHLFERKDTQNTIIITTTIITMSANAPFPLPLPSDSLRTRLCYHFWRALMQRHRVVAEVGYAHADYLESMFEQRRVRYVEFAVVSLIPAILLEWSVIERDELAAAVNWARNEHARLAARDCVLCFHSRNLTFQWLMHRCSSPSKSLSDP
jgi:hypothetical protein